MKKKWLRQTQEFDTKYIRNSYLSWEETVQY